jgi:hypothetical protein
VCSSDLTPRTMLSTRSGNDQVRQVEMLRTLLSLRKKLQTVAGDSRHIRTEPWVFYRFESEGLVAPAKRDSITGQEQ